MFEFTKKLMLAKLIRMEEGQISLMGLPVTIIPVSILAELQKVTINNLGYKKAFGTLYNSSKEGSEAYNREFIKIYKIKNFQEILDWQSKIVTAAGWGEVEFKKVDQSKKTGILWFKNSPYANAYGKYKYPTCIVQSGFVAGGVSITFNDKMDTLETKCVSKGDPYCEMEIGTQKVIEDKRESLWKNLNIK